MMTKYFKIKKQNKKLKAMAGEKATLEEKIKLLEDEKADFNKSREAWKRQKEKFLVDWEKSLDDIY